MPFSCYFALEHVSPQGVKKRLEASRNRHYPLADGVKLNRDIERVTSLAAAKQAFSRARMPVLWEKGAAGMAITRWSPPLLARRAGNRPVKILSLPGLETERNEFTERVMSLKEYLGMIKKNQAYLRFSDLIENAPELKQDLPLHLLNDIAGNPGRVNLQFFLGARQAMTPLHAEMNCNIFIQAFGRKRWVVFPPEAMLHLQPPSAGRFYFFSPLNALAKNAGRKTATAIEGTEIILGPGDILLVPPLVWHTAENLSLSCSVGFKYNRYFRALRASPLLFAMNALARNPSYFTYLWHSLVLRRHPILATK